MKPIFRAASLSALALILAGCATSKPTVEQGISAAMLPDKTDLTTALAPLDAIERVNHVFADLRFSVQENDLDRFNLHPGAAGDYFFATVAATGANDTRTFTVAQWQSEGATVVHFSSNLDKPEHDYVVSRLKQVLAEQPKAAQAPNLAPDVTPKTQS